MGSQYGLNLDAFESVHDLCESAHVKNEILQSQSTSFFSDSGSVRAKPDFMPFVPLMSKMQLHLMCAYMDCCKECTGECTAMWVLVPFDEFLKRVKHDRLAITRHLMDHPALEISDRAGYPFVGYRVDGPFHAQVESRVEKMQKPIRLSA